MTLGVLQSPMSSERDLAGKGLALEEWDKGLGLPSQEGRTMRREKMRAGHEGPWCHRWRGSTEMRRMLRLLQIRLRECGGEGGEDRVP